MPTWSDKQGLKKTIDIDYDRGCRVMRYEFEGGIGTHIDAPAHFVPGGITIENIPLEKLVAPAYVIDVTTKVARNDTYMISADDLVAFEKTHGNIEPNSIVVGYTGWSKYWHDPAAYHNFNNKKQMKFPGFSPEAADFLLNRTIVGLGIDTLSPDGSNTTFPVHKKLLKLGVYLLENLTNLDAFPIIGSYIGVFPLKVTEGTEAPARVIGFIPPKK
jgi:kynurenine formamidase